MPRVNLAAGGPGVASSPSRSVSCRHMPACPAFDAPGRDAAVVLASHPEQGWSLLCNGVVVFEDTGELLPSGAAIAPHRPEYHAPLDLAGGAL